MASSDPGSRYAHPSGSLPAARSCSVSHAAYSSASAKLTYTTGCRPLLSGSFLVPFGLQNGSLECSGFFLRYSSFVTSNRPTHICIASIHTYSAPVLAVRHG